jgi:hypothetical protein
MDKSHDCRFCFARFFPSKRESPFRGGDSSLAFATNSSSLFFGTARTPRMTSLKCANSGVLSKARSFITLPKQACAFRAPVSSCSSWAHLCLRFFFAGEFAVGNAATNNLLHDTAETLRVRSLPVVVAERLFVDVSKQMEWFHTDVGAMQAAL